MTMPASVDVRLMPCGYDHRQSPLAEGITEGIGGQLPPKRRQPRPLTFNTSVGLFDEVNLALLRELQAEPRIAVSQLARRIGMSAPAVRERIGRLEAAGVIAGYQVLIDPVSVGLPITAFVRIRPVAGALPKLAKLAADTLEVSECYRITGEDCFLIKLHAPALDQLESILDRFLPFGNTTTSIVVSTTVPLRQPPLPGPDTMRES
jgi:Lrp/AsnC family leucine-responsive transcriptional regulator